MSMALYVPDRDDDEADLRLKIFRRDASMSLSRDPAAPDPARRRRDRRAPVRARAGPGRARLRLRPRADRARRGGGGPVALDTGGPGAVHGGLLRLLPGAERAGRLPRAGDGRRPATGATSPCSGRSAATCGRSGVTYSQTYIAQALSANVDLARLLVSPFADPVRPRAAVGPAPPGWPGRPSSPTTIKTGLNDVVSLDHDRIIRWYLAVLSATVRTNFYASGRQAIALKLLPAADPGPARAAAASSRSSSTRPGWRACTCGSGRWPAAGCAGPTGPRTSAPRSWAWSRPRW